MSSTQIQAWEDRRADREKEERECAETPEQRKENDRIIRESLDRQHMGIPPAPVEPGNYGPL